MNTRLPLLLAAALGLVPGCQKTKDADGASKAPLVALDAGSSVDAAARSSVSSADAGPAFEFTGTVRGVVRLAKGQKLPFAPFPQLNGATPPSVAPCPPVDASDQKNHVSLSKQTGGLYPVHVALTGMRGAPTREPVMHELYIDACRMRPTLVGALRGDKVRITNRSKSALVPRVPGTSFMRGLLEGESTEAPLKQTRTTVDCSFGSFCGESLLVATSHTLYAVTSPEGFFTIEHVPLDQDITVHAWNPLFEVDSSKPIRLTHAQPEQMVELTLTPTPAAAATKLGAPKPVKPKVIVERLDGGGIIVHSPGPAYE